MTYHIIIEPTAGRGIREAIRWITEQSSPHAAAKWFNGLIGTIDTLKAHPHRWPLAPESEKFPVEIRELLHGKHKRGKYRILFTIAGDTVHVLYIRHSAQDELEL